MIRCGLVAWGQRRLRSRSQPSTSLARRIFFGQRGELRQHHRKGMEDQPFFRPA